MKRYAIAAKTALILLATSLSLSCSLMGPQTGSMSISFPEALLIAPSGSEAQASRALFVEGTTKLNVVRIYLESNGALLPLYGKDYFEKAGIDGTSEVKLADIPPVRNCKLYIALGAAEGTSFRPVKYAASASFDVVVGTTKTVVLEPVGSLFKDLYIASATETAAIKALEIGGITYIAAGGKLTWKEGSLDKSLTLDPGLVVNSLSAGKAQGADGTLDLNAPRLWLNTGSGIYILSLDRSSLAKLRVQDSSKTFRDLASNVLESFIVHLSYASTDSSIVQADALIYQGAGKLGGAFSSDGGSWTWFDIADYMDKLGTLKGAIEGSTSKIIADLVIDSGGSYGYAIAPSPIGSIRLGGDTINKLKGKTSDQLTSDIMSTVSLIQTGNTISVPKYNAMSPTIQSLSKAGNSLYLGTHLGLYKYEVDPSTGSLPTGAASRVELLGKTVNAVRVRATKIGETLWTAVLAKNGSVWLVKSAASGFSVFEYPFYTGIPDFKGDAAAKGDLFWSTEGLIITGNNGAVLLANALLP